MSTNSRLLASLVATTLLLAGVTALCSLRSTDSGAAENHQYEEGRPSQSDLLIDRANEASAPERQVVGSAKVRLTAIDSVTREQLREASLQVVTEDGRQLQTGRGELDIQASQLKGCTVVATCWGYMQYQALSSELGKGEATSVEVPLRRDPNQSATITGLELDADYRVWFFSNQPGETVLDEIVFNASARLKHIGVPRDGLIVWISHGTFVTPAVCLYPGTT